MPTDLIEELERLAAEATPGPWKADQHGLGVFPAASGPIVAALMNKSGAFTNHEANAALIVAAINALPRLLEIARAAEKVDAANRSYWHEAQASNHGSAHEAALARQEAGPALREAFAALRSALHPEVKP